LWTYEKVMIMGRKFEVRKEAMQKTHLKRSKLYARYGKAIYMKAKEGGVNVETNHALKHLLERAKKDDVPNDVVERNLKKAQEKGGEDFETARYEGFGPGGSAFLIDALTDNVNRTVSDVRYCFTKIGSKIGVKGSVEHMYDHLAKLHIKGIDEDDVLETLFAEDIELYDIETDEEGIFLTAAGTAHDAIERTLREQDVEILYSNSGWYPQNTVELSDEEYALFEKLMRLLNDVDDVQAVYHNVEMKDE